MLNNFDRSGSLIITPGGDGVVSAYRIDTARVQNPRTATLSSVAGDVLTLSSAVAGLFFRQSLMAGVSYVRIWNTTKSQSAWVKAQPSTTTLQVTSASDVSTWANGDTIRLGEGTSNGSGIAIDISPMMQAILGTTFRQSGILARVVIQGSGELCQIGLSADGSSGSYFALESGDAGTTRNGCMVVPCTQQSPISNTNLIILRETDTITPAAANVLISALSVMGVFK
jgi:hypothetical protein